MFGLTRLVYIRDYIQGLQSQLNPSAWGQDNDELCENFLVAHELPKLGKEQPRSVEASSEKLVSCVTQEPSLLINSTNTSTNFLELDQSEFGFQKCVGLAPQGNVWNPSYLPSHLTHTNLPQKIAANSEPDCSSKHEHGSEHQYFSATVSQRKVEQDRKPSDSREQVVRSTALGALTKIQHPPQRHVPPLPYALTKSEYTSRPIAQSGSKLRRLSPLRESSGNIHRSTEIEQQSLGKYS